MDSAEFQSSITADLARDILIGRIKEQRRQDEQAWCDGCGDVMADYREELEEHLCRDCYEEIATDDSDQAHNDPRTGQAAGLNR